jgi:PKD repeat protein
MVTIMKNIKSILLLMLAIFVVSCVEVEPDYKDFPTKDVDFVFEVEGNEYTTDFYYVSPIKFKNTSFKKGALSWDFNGDGKVDSNEENPTYKYDAAGKYYVTLTVEGVGSRTYPVQVMDITPVLSIATQSDSLVLVDQSVIELAVELPNPEGKECSFVWEFEEGTTLADGTPISTYEGENPGALKFKNIGSNKITLKTRFDVAEGGENRALDPSFVNIQVAYTEEVPTLYYASYGGNVKALKVIPEGTLPEGVSNKPFDMCVSCGVTPQNLVYASVDGSDFIYIIDSGKNFGYQNDTDGVLGDGKITVMSADGTYANLVITNVGGHAFSDPFHGCVSADGANLLYTDRNNGVSAVALTARGEVEKRLQSNVSSYNVVNNNTLGYYGRGIAYGAAHSAIYQASDGVYWWPKNYNAAGIFRFRQSDIGVTDAAPTKILLDGATLKAFTLDEKRKHMYCFLTSGEAGVGFAQYPLVKFEEGLGVKDYTTFVKMAVAPIAGATDSKEALYVAQFALDKETGNVYFGFTPDGDSDRPTGGLYYYDYAAGTVVKTPIKNTENDKIIGICLNPRKTQLF